MPISDSAATEQQRLWREEGLQRPTPCKEKRARPADGSVR